MLRAADKLKSFGPFDQRLEELDFAGRLQLAVEVCCLAHVLDVAFPDLDDRTLWCCILGRKRGHVTPWIVANLTLVETRGNSDFCSLL